MGNRLVLAVWLGWVAVGGASAWGRAVVPLEPLGALWTRDNGAGSAEPDAGFMLDGVASVHVHHTGARDWSLGPGGPAVAVRTGELLLLSAQVRNPAVGSAELSFNTLDAAGQTVDWMAGLRKITGASTQFRTVRAHWVVPAGVAAVRPRITGTGAIDLSVGNFKLEDLGQAADFRPANLPASVSVENASVRVSFDTIAAAFSVVDLRTNRPWRQTEFGSGLVVTGCVQPAPNQMRLTLRRISDDQSFTAAVQLEPADAEFAVTLHADPLTPLPEDLQFPPPFVTDAGTSLVVPLNEGISYPVDDPAIPEMSLIAYGGHGICMSFFGAADPATGSAYSAILETADDAEIQIARRSATPGAPPRLCITPRWQSQRGLFGYDRTVRYTFFTQGAHVAIAKRYRRYVQQIGRFKTLATKRQAVPAVDLLVGAANIWCWEPDPVQVVKELQAAGIDHILWSAAANPDQLREMNRRGVLTSRYDIYQDVMDPAQYAHLQYTQPDWPAAAWPHDLLRDETGDWQKGWGIERKDGPGMIPCGIVCDSRAVGYAMDRIGRELQTHPYACRFIDTTTASPFRECYDPRHPMTRTQSRQWKMQLLDTVSGHFHLVCGSETGHDAAVPYADYFEGMLSLGPYRVPDAGRDMSRIWTDVPAVITQFQLGQNYRLPLWELVYHDCVVAHWYWGDYNNKLPAVWDKRDLFNALYGTAPMFMFDADLWHRQQARFVQSYRATCPLARAVGYSEMVDHRFLTADRNVQQTAFANGRRVTVNFGELSFSMPDGTTVAAHTDRITGGPG